MSIIGTVVVRFTFDTSRWKRESAPLQEGIKAADSLERTMAKVNAIVNQPSSALADLTEHLPKDDA